MLSITTDTPTERLLHRFAHRLAPRRGLWREIERLHAIIDEHSTLLAEGERRLRDREQALRDTNARQAMILRMERELAGSADPRHAAGVAARAARLVSGASAVAIWLFDDNAASLRLAADTAGTSFGPEGPGPSLECATDDSGMMGRALAERQPVSDGVEWAWPLVVANRVTGVLVLTPGPIEVDDAIGDAVATLAIHAAASIEAARLYAEQQQLARLDPLTCLPNRRAFDEDLSVERERSRRHHTPVSLVMIDLDHFKAINDAHGHSAGDEVLRVVAAALTGALRSSDTAYRLGGEEFAVLARDTGVVGASVLAERLRTCVETTVEIGCDQVAVTASLGVAELGTIDLDVRTLVATADAALFAAKRSGRNRVEARSCGAEVLAAIT